MNGSAPIPVGARVWVSDVFYTGVALVLEYDSDHRAFDAQPGETPGPYYCHLLNNCDHDWCPDDDDCAGEDCRGWYSVEQE